MGSVRTIGTTVVFAWVLGACAVGVPPVPGTPPPEAGAYPVQFPSRFGFTTLVRQPVRVVTLGLVDQDAFLAMGVVPVASREWFGNMPGTIFPWAQPKLGVHPLPEVLTNTLNFEKIASLRPDVIVALYASLSTGDYQSLSRIAPTVAAPPGVADWGISWQELTRISGRIVGRPSAAEALVNDVEQAFAAARRAHPEFGGKSAAILSGYGWPQTYYAYSSRDGRSHFLQGLGFVLPREFDTAAGGQFGVSLAKDKLPWTDRSLVVWLTASADQEGKIRGDDLWKSTKASREGRAVFLPPASPYYAALNFASVLSLPYAIAGLVPSFQAALDGNRGN